jgi:hypothetical protein
MLGQEVCDGGTFGAETRRVDRVRTLPEYGGLRLRREAPARRLTAHWFCSIN